MQLTLLSVLLLLQLSLWTIVLANQCIHRDYGNNGTVCVCQADYCDTISLRPFDDTRVHAYCSSQSGDRFAFHSIQLNRTYTTSPAVRVKVHRQLRNGPATRKIIGFGGAFTDSAGYNIAQLPRALQRRLIQDYFGSDGIEYTLGRINIGGCDFSTRPYTYDDFPGDDNLDKFQLQREDYDWKIPYLKLAKQVSAHPENVKFFGSTWSPPAWMKNNKNLIHGGVLIGQAGGKYYKMFAKYLVKFLDEYTKNNVTVWGITIDNEPSTGFNPNYRWNCLGFTKETERDFLKTDLGPELWRAGYTKDKLTVMIFDDQLPDFKAFSTTVLSDVEAAKYASGIAFHWYANRRGNKSDIDDVLNQFPDTFVLSTEACEIWPGKPVHVSLGNWATFDKYAKDIIEDLNHSVSGWVDWNIVLDLQGGPNWAGNYVDAPIIVNATGGEYYKQPFFYALGHFSKFLVPGSQLVRSDVNNDLLKTTVFIRPDNRLVLIVLNVHTKDVPLEVEREGTRFQLNVKAKSMYSLVWKP